MRNERLLLLTLAAINFTHIVDFMIMMPLGPALMRIFQITPQNHAALVSAYTFAAGTTGFLSAFMVDRFDRKKVLFWAYLFFGLGTLACAFAPTYHWLLFTRAFAGSFGGVLGAMVLSIVGDVVPFERRGAAMGFVMASFSVASVAGVPFSLFLANHFNWHAPFLFVGGVSFLILGLIIKFIPEMRGHIVAGKPKVDPLATLRLVWQDHNQLKALSLTALLMLGQFSIIPFLSPYMVSNTGLPESSLPWIYFCGGGMTIFTSPRIGRLSDVYGKKMMFTLFSLLMLIPILWITNMGITPTWMILISTTLFFIFGNGRFVPASTMTTAVVKPEHRGSFMSINSCVQQMSAGLASYVAGFIVSANATGQLLNYNLVGYMAVFFAILAVIVGRKIVLS